VHYLRCELFPQDLDASVDFYLDVLGFELERDERAASGYVSLRLGDIVVGLLRAWSAAEPEHRKPPVGVELVLVVDDVVAARDRVRARAWPIAEDLERRPWGLTDFRLLDPDGYYLRITQEPGIDP